MTATPERRAELLLRMHEGGALNMSELNELGIHPEDVDEIWMDEMVKRQSWPREFEQGDKWIFCLIAARIAAKQERL